MKELFFKLIMNLHNILEYLNNFIYLSKNLKLKI